MRALLVEHLPESGTEFSAFCSKDQECLDVGAALWSKLCAIEDALRYRRCKADLRSSQDNSNARRLVDENGRKEQHFHVYSLEVGD